MYIKFKNEIEVILQSEYCRFSGSTKKERKKFKADQVVRIAGYSLVGEPNKKVKTRPGKPGGRTTFIRISLHSDKYWEMFDSNSVDVDEWDLPYFIIDQQHIELIKEPQRADN